MRSFFLSVLFCLACMAPALAQSNNTFLKVIANFKRGYTICPSGDGNLYVGGVVIGRTVLLKIAPNGQVINTYLLDFATSNLDNISELIVDSEGMIVGCGTQGVEELRRGFVFRYNPLTHTVLWARTLNDDVATLSGLLEKSPGGNYLAYGEVFYQEALMSVSSDAIILQIDRHTGALVVSGVKRYHLGKNASFNAIVAHDSTLYAVGRAVNGMSVFTDLFIRSALVRLEPVGITPLWTRLSGAPLTTGASLRGRDLVIDDTSIITTYSGNLTDPSLSTTTFFLQKHHFDGTIEWARKYDLAEWTNEVAEEVISVPNGYILYGQGRNSSGSSLFVVKTDKNGNPLWSRKLHYDANDGFAQTESQQGQIVALGNSLFFTATTEQTNGASRMLLAKINADGTMSGDCTYWQPTQVTMTALTTLANTAVTLQVNSGVTPFLDIPHNVLPGTANVAAVCEGVELSLCTDTLDLGPDVILCQDSIVIFNAGSGFVSYLWQDGSTDSTYSANVPDVYWVEVVDSCGGIQRDSVLLTVSLLADTQFPDVSICLGQSLTYTLSGFNSYLWSPTAGLDCDTCATVIIQSNTTTTYSLLAQSNAGCILTDTFTINVGLVANLSLADTTICPHGSLTYSVPGFDTYRWMPAGSLSCDTCATVIIQPNTTTTYTLLAQNSSGCIATDTFTVAVSSLPNIQLADTTICPGASVQYTVPGFATYLWTPSAGLNCDTCATVIIQPTATTTYILLAQNSRGCLVADTFTVAISRVENLQIPDTIICPGATVSYSVPGFDTYVWSPAAGLNCDTCTTVVIQPTSTTTYSLLAQNSAGCVANDTFTVNISSVADLSLADTTICLGENLTYTVPGFANYVWTPTVGLHCDTCATVLIQPTSTTTYSLLAQNSLGCIVRDTFTVNISSVANLHLADTTICLGENLTYTVPGFATYHWTPAAGLSCDTCATVLIQPNTTTNYIVRVQNSIGCAAADTFQVTVRPLPTRTEVIEFLPGDTVVLGGTSYTQPDTIMLTVPAAVGCDTLVTYILQLQTAVSIACTSDIMVEIPVGDTLAIVDYTLPTAETTCPGGALNFTLLTNVPGGNLFPLGATEVCYRVTDACGNSDTCCFRVQVAEQIPPCDAKVNGCIRYELLYIKLDSIGNRRYTIRVINNCSDAVLYTTFELPNGVVAVAPTNGSVFTAASGRSYLVQNPNFSPFYSIQFKAQPGTLLQSGLADIFTYKLPQQSTINYIRVTTKLANNQSYFAILNTFNCPVQPYSNASSGPGAERATKPLSIFPNPTDGLLFADLSAWAGQKVGLQVFNAQGQLQQSQTVVADDLPQALHLPAILVNGLYFLEVRAEHGQREVQRFVVQR